MPSNQPTSPEDFTRIGWRERIALPDWDISKLRAKIDTGACHSALDAIDVEQVDDDHIRFLLVIKRRPELITKEVIAPMARQASVRSSLGDVHERLVVQTDVQIGSVHRTVEFGLVDRSAMRYRSLIGRSALAPDLLVDSNYSYLLSGKTKQGPSLQ